MGRLHERILRSLLGASVFFLLFREGTIFSPLRGDFLPPIFFRRFAAILPLKKFSPLRGDFYTKTQ